MWICLRRSTSVPPHCSTRVWSGALMQISCFSYWHCMFPMEHKKLFPLCCQSVSQWVSECALGFRYTRIFILVRFFIVKCFIMFAHLECSFWELMEWHIGCPSVRPSIHKYLQLPLWNYTYDFDETWPQPSSPRRYQSLFMALKQSSSKGVSGGCPPKPVFAFFSETTHAILMKIDHNLHHLWCTKVWSRH